MRLHHHMTDRICLQGQAALRALSQQAAALLRRRAVAPEIACKQIEIVMLSMPLNLSAGIAAVFLVLAGFWLIPKQLPDGPAGLTVLVAAASIAWAAALIAVLVRGIRISRQYPRCSQSVDATLALGEKLSWNALCAGALWGSSSFLMLGVINPDVSAFMLAAIALVIMGGSGAQAPYARLVRMFVLGTTAVFAIGTLVNSRLHPVLAAGFMLYGLVALAFANELQKSVAAVIALSLEKEQVLERANRALADATIAKAEAERANNAKTRFLAAASHDLRQPMHALALYVGHLKRSAANAEITDTIRKIDDATAAMEELLNALLDLSKISSGTIAATVGAVALDDILGRLDDQLGPQARSKALTLELRRAGLCVLTDALLFERVLRNLVINAICYTQQGEVLVRAKRRATQVLVQVADTGIGIARTEGRHVFEEYYQVHNQERDRRRGLGLGLAIVAQLCSLLGHPVSYKSKVGKGTIFRLQLPACAVPAQPRVPEQLPPPQLDLVCGALILLVDDDPLPLDSMTVTLRDFGCHVIAASSASEALDRLQGEERMPDCVISDYRLRHGLSGIDAIRTIRESLHGDAAAMPLTPALLVSGDTSPAVLKEVLRQGLPLLHKPVNPARLYAALNGALLEFHHALGSIAEREP